MINEKFTRLTFQLIELINSNHQFTFLMKSTTKVRLIEIIINQFRSHTFAEIDRTCATFETSDSQLFFV